MIIACPACSTKYVVPDTAIGVDGRTVRCAKCRHSWHQDGPELDLGDFQKTEQPAEPSPTPPPDTPTEPAEDTKPGFSNTHQTTDEVPSAPAPATAADAAQEVESEAIAAESPDALDDDEVASPPPTVVETEPAPTPEPETFYYDETSQFDYEPPFRSRRNPLKIWTAAAVLFAVVALGTIAAGSFYGWPEWMPVSKPTFAVAQPDLVLDFPADQQDRNTSPDGTEYFGVSGTITNTGRETRNVPSILIVMRDQRNQLVYSKELVPSQASLAPGEAITVNEAVNDIPKRAKFAEIGWKPS